jgi:hypothetical protein
VSRHHARAHVGVPAGDLGVLLDAAARHLGRGLLLLGWCAVLWGTLLLVSMGASVFTDGLDVVLGHLDPRGRPGLVPWVNFGCVVLAPLVWASVAVFLTGGRSAGSSSS